MSIRGEFSKNTLSTPIPWNTFLTVIVFISFLGTNSSGKYILSFKTTTFIVPYSNGEIINVLKEHCDVLDIVYDDFIYITASVNEKYYNLYKKYEKK